MNHTYKHIWSKTLGRLVIVPECCKGGQGRKGGKAKIGAAASIAATLLASPALAQSVLPTGGTVISGAASIATSGAAMTINQSSDKLIANWQSFSIGSGNSVTFNQPGASSVALNRVTGQDASQILGSLTANGQVFLVNPNGIAIGKTGSVQTGGFVASTLGISDANFLAGNYRFTGTSGTITNEGTITGKTVALISPVVSNSGTITGNTALAAGTDVQLDFNGDGLLSVEVKASTMATLVENKGLIRADGGVAILTAKGASAAMKGVVNNTGTIEANSIGTRNGRILLLGDMQHGEVKAAGKLKAKFVETSAAKVSIDKDLKVDTQGGGWLIDPTDIIINASEATVYQNALATGDVTITTAGTGTDAGNITVNAPITWSSHILTLRADSNIYIKAPLTSFGATLADGLVLRFAQANGNGEYVINAPVNLAAGSLFRTQFRNETPITYTVITSLGLAGSTTGTDLQGIGGNLSGNYVLGANIDASATAGWNGGAGFSPLGAQLGTSFSGRLDGLGHTIRGLRINRNDGTQGTGLFGAANNAEIRNLGLLDVDIGGSSSYVGALVGQLGNSALYDVYATGKVRGVDWVGGLVGRMVNANAFRSYADVAVSTNGNYIGGFGGEVNNSRIDNSYASGSVSGSTWVGGLVGKSYTLFLNGSWASGKVTGLSSVGGLIGARESGTVNSSFWDVDTTGQSSGCGDTGCGTGLNTANALLQASYGGLDFGNVWYMIDGSTRPFLRSEWSTEIVNTHQLQLMALNLGANYRLAKDLDFGTALTDSSRSDMWATSGTAGGGFLQIGNSSTPFTGRFDGQNFTIANLLINRTSDANVGLFGYVSGATIGNVALRDVTIKGGSKVGGLVGAATNATIGTTSVSGSVLGTGDTVGGLAGQFNGGTINNSFVTAVVTGANNVGGLVGASSAGTISNSYASGFVTGSGANVGSLAGTNAATITASFWNSSGTGLTNGCGSNSGTCAATGLTAAQMNDPFRFIDAGWNFTTIWQTPTAGGAPVLRGRAIEPVYNYYIRLTGNLIRDYGDSVAASGITLQGNGTSYVTLSWGSAVTSSTNVGTYAWSGNNVLTFSFSNGTSANYYIDYGDGGLTINKRTVNLSGSRTYDGTTNVNANALTLGNLANGETLSLSGIGQLASKNAGTGLGFDLATLALGNGTGLASNYTFSGGTRSIDIAKAAITSITGITANNKTYDGTTNATLVLSGAMFNGKVSGDVLTVATSAGSFVNKTAATGKTVNVNGLTLGGADAANYTLSSTTASASADIAKAIITSITGITVGNKIYDGTTDAVLNTSAAVFNGKISGDALSVATGTGAFSNKNAADGKTVNISGLTLGGTDAGNYTLSASTASTTANIAKALITSISGITATNKTYDGTTDVTLVTSGAVFNGLVAGEQLTLTSVSGAFANKNAGAGKLVNITGLSLGGADVANYELASTTASTTADVAKAAITSISGITASNKTYDGTDAASLVLSGAMFNGKVSGDVLTVATSSGAFSDKNAATGKTVNITGLSLGGTDAGNYTLSSSTASTTADIAKAVITSISGITAGNKTYDGTDAATLVLTGATFNGKVAGDVLTVATSSGAFDNKNAGTGKTVNISGLSLGGTDAGNYTLSSTTAATTADIAKAIITSIAGIAASNRTYDGTDAATLVTSGAVFNGKISGDVLTVATGAGAFSDKNAGAGKTVNITGLTLGGTDAGNYTLSTTTASTTADIAKAVITSITGITATNRTYDGTTDVALVTAGAGFSGKISGDVLTVATASGALRDKNAGTGKTVDITGLTLGGTDAGNYTLSTTTATTTVDIAKAIITSIAGITAGNKTYDGTADAALVTSGAVFNGKLSGDVLTVAAGTGAFSGKDVGNGLTVGISGLTLGGTDAGNYTLSSTTASTTANIVQRVLSLSGGRVYDGTTDVAASVLTLGNLVSGETLVLSGAGQLGRKDAGSGRSLALGTLALGNGSGTASNYTLTGGATTVDIAKAVLTLSGFTAGNKVYDGSTAASILSLGTLLGAIGGDSVSFAATSATFADKNAGTGKTVTLNGVLNGADAGNYTLASGTATTTADINRAVITAITGISALSKPYDGNTTAALVTSGAVFNGMVAGDLLSIASGTGTFADANSGTGKLVNITGLSLGGLDARNYTLASTTATTSADINASVAPVLPPPNTIDTGTSAINSIGSTVRQSFVITTADAFAQPQLIDLGGPGNRNDTGNASANGGTQEEEAN